MNPLKSMSRRTQWIVALVTPIVLLAGYVGMQLIVNERPTNPPAHTDLPWPDEESAELALDACYDCHSHITAWPWYTRIWPMSDFIQHDVEAGREYLNFSKMAESCCTREQIDRAAETVNSGTMPLPYYIPLHPDADLSSDQRGVLVHGLIEVMREYCTDCE